MVNEERVMVKNYWVIAIRALRRHPGYALINVLGLGLGMAACLLLGLYVHEELSHDAFHENADRIVAVGVESDFFSGKGHIASYPLAEVLLENVPGVERIVRTRGEPTKTVVRRLKNGELERTERLLVADSTFFEVFSFPLLKGAATEVLDAPGQAVITEKTAQAFFGSENPIGRILSLQVESGMFSRKVNHTITVAGVAKDPPSNSTFQFDIVVPSSLVSMTERANWGVFRWTTFMLLERPMRAETFTEQMQRAAAPHKKGNFMFSKLELHAVPLSDLYLSEYFQASGFRGQKSYIYLFSTIALLILFVATINYVNLVTAQSQQRAKEVGVRKAVGARRNQLAVQFLGETTVLSLLALVVALVVFSVVLPGFNGMMGTSLSLSAAWTNWALPGVAGFVLVVSIASGAYPALVLSSFRPVQVLRGRSSTRPGTRGWMRRGLVVAQFTVSAALILCSFLMYAQLNYMQTKHLGFEGERVVTIELPDRNQHHLHVKQQVRAIPGVEHASVAGAAPGDFGVRIGNFTERISPSARTQQEQVSFRAATVDADYVETLGLKLVAGRSFREDRPSDRTQAYVLNEAAVQTMGWTVEEAVGKPFTYARREGAPEGKVIGVVENFHVKSLRDPISPVVLQMEASRYSSSSFLLARLAPGQIRAVMDRIENIVRSQTGGETISFAFLDDTFDAMYRSEQRMASLFAVFAGLAAGIACLGLFGLAAFAAEQRTKEIAIRKVMGAFVPDIVRVVSKEFAVLAAVALIVGIPLAYWGMQQWLQGFAYQTSSTPWMLVLTVVTTLLISVGSTSYHAVRAALANPTEALR